jgi:spore cortex biosynthesis protein YabQ
MLAGSAVGFLFDIYRSFRRGHKIGFLITFIGDIFFSLGALILLIYFLNKANALAFRFYVLWGSLLGLFIYLRLLSSFTLRILFWFHRLLRLLIKCLLFILYIPYRGLLLLTYPFYAFLHWLGLLLFRIGETLLGPSFCRFKNNIIEMYKRFFPL